jgi:acyl carrier protein
MAFAKTFKDDEDSIVMETRFRELEEWSSMQALIVIAAIDENYGVTIPEKDFRSASTVQELYELVINA